MNKNKYFNINDFDKELEDFKATDGWLSSWNEIYIIVYKDLHGEKQDSDNWQLISGYKLIGKLY